jgi:DNA-binding SARP family transcriptional activator
VTPACEYSIVAIPHHVLFMTSVTLRIVGDSAIEWQGQRLTATAPQLFALMLLLTLDAQKPRTRRALETFLFEEDQSEHGAAHSLRQLIYRLRRVGLDVADEGGFVTLGGANIPDPLAELKALPLAERSALSAGNLTPFPEWHPRLPDPFLEWLDGQRKALSRRISLILRNDVECATQEGNWVALGALAQLLGEVDPGSHDWRVPRAESLFMLGRQSEALETIDALLEADPSSPMAQHARGLRSRISRRTPSSVPPALRGRNNTLAFLTRAWEEAAQGGARQVNLIGPAGIGKTRVADEFTAVARLRGGVAVTYRCDPAARPYPLALFAHILPELRSRRGSLGVNPRHLAILERLRPSGEPVVDPELDTYTPEQIRSEMHDALSDLVEAVSEETPLLIVVDDAHMLDRHSASLLRGLVTGANSARTLILACCRPQEGAQAIMAPGERASSHTLETLCESDSRALPLPSSVISRR